MAYGLGRIAPRSGSDRQVLHGEPELLLVLLEALPHRLAVLRTSHRPAPEGAGGRRPAAARAITRFSPDRQASVASAPICGATTWKAAIIAITQPTASIAVAIRTIAPLHRATIVADDTSARSRFTSSPTTFCAASTMRSSDSVTVGWGRCAVPLCWSSNMPAEEEHPACQCSPRPEDGPACRRAWHGFVVCTFFRGGPAFDADGGSLPTVAHVSCGRTVVS